MKRILSTLLLLTVSLVLGACGGPSFEEESKKAITEAKTSFEEKKEETNQETEEIAFYLPFGFEVEDVKPNNIILKNGAKTYILFYNPHENKESRVVYEATTAQYNNPDVNEEFNGEGKFGYLLIKQLEEGLNSLTTGIGGVKVSTETKTGSLDDEAREMMRIANSVELNKK
ncbi:hypothetical protein A8F94_06060 [Bacillus sp. FJAT-27225]|uniref:hypothetical protein n=1 Tax=Bacillus sp. FJAT-27225 TaxID=1743144 RepID=UPI00080C20CA|nr:hypothetical protein [Bacillus sp. FJAT-27225]OCA91416.1 hypothetical protein A8F94_06060 [Bacillus sp. FJAT-27225]